MDENILDIIKNNKVKILGASKTKSLDKIFEVYNQGITIFGENYVNELKEKYQDNLPFDFHFIGKIQTNKIKDIVRCSKMIHSVSREKEIKEISKECIKQNKNIDILIELHLTNEETKNGVSINELDNLINCVNNYPNIHLKGFMVMGPNNDNINETIQVFKTAQIIFNEYKNKITSIDTLSMGMSNDYKEAIKYGATLIRLGTILFGSRNY